MTMAGADIEALVDLGRLFERAAEQLDRNRRDLGYALHSTDWRGVDAHQFTHSWTHRHDPQLLGVATFLGAVARQLARNAEEQRVASALDGSAGSSGIFGSAPGRNVRESNAILKQTTGRAAIVEAFYGTTDSRRASSTEIEITRLDNGRYIVVLPGVNDLGNAHDLKTATSHLNAIGLVQGANRHVNKWFDNNTVDSVRKTKYALGDITGDGSNVNAYAEVVKAQMRRSGVPEGADVMLIGHSYGAYTAMDLAASSSFNQASGHPSGYHVNVTHVLAAGAEVDWRLKELPSSTHAMVLNNKHDLVFQGEDLVLGRHPRPNHTSGGKLNVVFNGGSEGNGHHPNNYADYLKNAGDRPAVSTWLEEAGGQYNSTGRSYAVAVPDLGAP